MKDKIKKEELTAEGILLEKHNKMIRKDERQKTAKQVLKKAEWGAIKWVREHSFDSGCSDVCKNIVIDNIKEEFKKLKKKWCK